jgi:hypothetical protein
MPASLLESQFDQAVPIMALRPCRPSQPSQPDCVRILARVLYLHACCSYLR